MPSFAVLIEESGDVSKVAFQGDAAMRTEVSGRLHTTGPEFQGLFGDFRLAYQHRDSLACIMAGDEIVHGVENPLASELAGFSNPCDNRIYGPAYIVATGSHVAGIQEEDANRLVKALRGSPRLKPVNRVWKGELVYVDELAPGQGFAYFMYGSENPSAFVGWSRKPREMYAEPPYDTPRVSVQAVGYKMHGLKVVDRESSVLEMSDNKSSWLVNDDYADVAFTSSIDEDRFVKCLREMRGAHVFVEK